jgi:hypothetical protein
MFINKSADASEEQSRQRAMAVRAQHNQVGSPLFSFGYDAFSWLTMPHDHFNLHLSMEQ